MPISKLVSESMPPRSDIMATGGYTLTMTKDKLAHLCYSRPASS